MTIVAFFVGMAAGVGLTIIVVLAYIGVTCDAGSAPGTHENEPGVLEARAYVAAKRTDAAYNRGYNDGHTEGLTQGLVAQLTFVREAI